MKGILSKIQLSPAQITMLSFLALSLIGTLLLLLPAAHNHGNWGDPMTAFFMSVSSVCVTGLAVTNVGEDFSLFGQTVILILMQVGGLSYMTMTTILLYLIGKKLSVTDSRVFDLSNNSDRKLNFAAFVFKIAFLTLCIEAVAWLLMVYDSYKIQLASNEAASIFYSAFQALFHSVSAFCNAGLSLYPNSLEGLRTNYWMLFMFSLLPILGGLGYTVMSECLNWFTIRHRKRRFIFSLHTRVSLIFTAAMLVIGVAVQLFLIYAQDLSTLNDQSFIDKLWVSIFQSVASRSSGFNSIPLPELGDASLLFLIVWMIIGACPGGTGGGIKLTTLAVIFAIVGSNIMERREVKLLNRSINQLTQQRAMIVFVSTILGIGLCLWLMTIFESGRGIGFIDLLFEVTSAFTTVGLSTGITTSLTDPSLLVLCLCMLVGRPGPLLFLMALALPHKQKPGLHPEEGILIG